MVIEDFDIKKPADWPQNKKEARLSNVLLAVEKFQNNPTYDNKELLLSLITELDPNQHDMFGSIRISDYEIALINELYFYASAMCLGALKVYLYKEITETIRIFNIISKFEEKIEGIDDVKKYSKLIPSLKLFYLAYQNYIYYKERTFCDELLETVRLWETIAKQGDDLLEEIEWAYTNLMLDISYSSGINTLPILEFKRDELLKLFEKEFYLINKLNHDPIKRPLKGVLKMTISNWILKSRNNYNLSSIFKCLNNDASYNSIRNKEIWMQDINYLNDKREGRVIVELFANKSWIQYEWAKRIKLNNPYTFYVTSFSKSYPTEELKHKYGKNVYGYRSDKIANIVAPIVNNNKFPQFGQTLCFDIIYDRDTAKEELNFLFKVIDILPLDNKQKVMFANEIMSYWYLSFKDKKWESENERRYQVFYYQDYPYYEVTKDERFLKIKSSVFLFPDNVSRDNNNFDYIKANIYDRYSSIATKEFIQCNDCLNIDYEVFCAHDQYVCQICGSKNCSRIDPNMLRHKN